MEHLWHNGDHCILLVLLARTLYFIRLLLLHLRSICGSVIGLCGKPGFDSELCELSLTLGRASGQNFLCAAEDPLYTWTCLSRWSAAYVLLIKDNFFIVSLHRRLLYTADPRCPKAKLSGNVPSLVLHISEQKVCQRCCILGLHLITFTFETIAIF